MANRELLIACYSCAHSEVGRDRNTGTAVLVCSRTLEKASGKCGEFEISDGE